MGMDNQKQLSAQHNVEEGPWHEHAVCTGENSIRVTGLWWTADLLFEGEYSLYAAVYDSCTGDLLLEEEISVGSFDELNEKLDALIHRANCETVPVVYIS